MLLFAAFLGAALLTYGPALSGPFVSDDIHYVARNPYVQELSLENAAAWLDPGGPATLAIVNYAPAQLAVHALAWRAFADETTGHHLLNIALHALASVLLAKLFASVGVPLIAALAGAALFLLHPANVEAVAWVSQLKSTLCMVLSLAALLVWERRPGLATFCFACALLAKATAVFALPVAGLLDWTLRGRVRWGWLTLWAVCFGGYAVAEFATHQRSGAADQSLHETPLVLMRTVPALALRYLAMAATSWGVSAFHEPEPATSWLDPWWLASVPVLGLLGWRAFAVLRRRDVEVAFWTWAAVSFAPVSQIFPFLYPLADRYLYFILPGLLGAVLLAGRDLQARLPEGFAPFAPRVALAAAGVIVLGFAVHSHDRAALWRSEAFLVADAAAHYPDGKAAHLRLARGAAMAGDAGASVVHLRRAAARGYNRFQQLETDSAWSQVRDDPGFRALVRELAGEWIEKAREDADPTQAELRGIAHAYIARGEIREALVWLERAVEQGGPFTDSIRMEVVAIRAAIESGSESSIRLGSAPGGAY